jgi:hypothetical protein
VSIGENLLALFIVGIGSECHRSKFISNCSTPNPQVINVDIGNSKNRAIRGLRNNFDRTFLEEFSVKPQILGSNLMSKSQYYLPLVFEEFVINHATWMIEIVFGVVLHQSRSGYFIYMM